MPLPKMEALTFEKYIAEIDTKVKYRPFLHKEHKLILQAVEMQDEAAVANAIQSLIDTCTFNQLDVENLSSHITDYLFILIFSKSVGVTNTSSYQCNYNKVNDNGEIYPCNRKFGVKINFADIEIMYPKNYDENRTVMLDKEAGVGMKLRVPSFRTMKELAKEQKNNNVVDIADKYIYNSIECIFDSDNVYTPGSDFTFEEFVGWLENCTSTSIDKINGFFQSIPQIGLDLPIRCPCGENQSVVELRGLDSFFG